MQVLFSMNEAKVHHGLVAKLTTTKGDLATFPPLKAACNRDRKEHNRTLTQNTGPLCPCKDLRHVHVLMSHSFNNWSLECKEINCIYVKVLLHHCYLGKKMEQRSISLNSGQEKTQIRLSGPSKFCSCASENGIFLVPWASEINLSNLVSDNFQSKTIISKPKTAR